MNLLADENIPPPVVEWLREEGHDVLAVREFARGSQDPHVLSFAAASRRVLLTRDRDFGELVYRRYLPAAGIVLLRIRAKSKLEFLNLFRSFWPRIEAAADGRFVVVTNRAVRFRPLPECR